MATHPAQQRPERSSLLVAAVLVLVAIVVGAGVALISDDDGPQGGSLGPFENVNARLDAFPDEVAPAGSSRTVPGAPEDTVEFLRFVTDDVQGFWAERFQRSGLRYRPAELVIFDRRVNTGCGPASDAVGPFYCPIDSRVYLDVSFFDELARRFRAPGDFAQAYVIAHEVGHHVQTLTGVTQQVDVASQSNPQEANELSIRNELMADCLAGVWAHSTYERGLLEEGDLEEGLRAAAAVGDDRIQAQTQGRITPETWTHGSSEQRVRWFGEGFRTGDPRACDTFGQVSV